MYLSQTFSESCRDLHRSVKNYEKLVNKFPYNHLYRKKFYSLRSKLRRLCKFEEKQYRNSICTQLNKISNKNPKDFQDLLHKLDKNKNPESNETNINHNAFIDFYKELNKACDKNNAFQTNINKEFMSLLENLNTKFVLSAYKEIKEEEILKAIRSLRNGKSSSSDMISNEMLKNAIPVLLKPLKKTVQLNL